MNDITSTIDQGVYIKSLADDCLIFEEETGTDDQVLLNSSLTGIDEWCATWGMSLNADKTVVLRVTNKKPPFQFSYSINGAPVVEKKPVRVLWDNVHQYPVLVQAYGKHLRICHAQVRLFTA